MPRCRRAFTLIELLVVVSLIATLIDILLPALGAARARSWDLKCLSNPRAHAEMTAIYLNSHNDTFPTRTSGVATGGGSVYGAFMPQRLILRFETRPLDILTCPLDTSRIRDYRAGRMDGSDQDGLGIAELYAIRPATLIRYSYGINNMTGIPPTTEEERQIFNSSASAYPWPARTLLYADCTWPNARGHNLRLNDAPQLKARVANAGSPMRLDTLATIPPTYARPLMELRRHRPGSNIVFMDSHAETVSQQDCFDKVLYSWTEK